MHKYARNTFEKGMQKDLDKAYSSPNSYLHAENMRLTVDKDSTAGSLENILGNEFIASFSPYYIIGHCLLNRYLVLFIASNTDGNPVSGDYSAIYRIELDDDNNIVSNTRIYFYYSGLNFTVTNPIKAIGRYENDSVQKVYFTDGLNPLRVINIVDPDLLTYNPDKFNIIQKINFSDVQLDSIISGELKSGVVQYTYKLYNKYGAESFFSPPSNAYHITSISEGTPEYLYKGVLQDTKTLKGFRLKISNSAGIFSKFDSIEVVALHYQTLNGVPEIRIIDRGTLDPNSSYYALDLGQSLGTYSIEEITTQSSSLFSAKDIDAKNNYLFASNITESYFDTDFDARAYRFNPNGIGGTCYLYHDQNNRIVLAAPGNNPTTLEFQKYSSGSWVRDDNNQWGLPGLSSGYTEDLMALIPKEHNCINYYNDCASDFTSSADKTNKYQINGTTLGGTGLNVSYRFTVSNLVLDSNKRSVSAYSDKNSGGAVLTDNIVQYASYSSPVINAKYKGFKRDETYRFGIVLIDDYGRESFVKWIGDIRMPYTHDIDDSVKYTLDGQSHYDFCTTYRNSTSAVTFYNKLSVTFTVSNLPIEAKYYKIVFVKRTESDKSIKAQGVVSRTGYCTHDDSYRPIMKFPQSYCVGGDFHYPSYSYSIVNFISPEISFNKTLNHYTGDYIRDAGYIDSVANITGLPSDNFIYPYSGDDRGVGTNSLCRFAKYSTGKVIGRSTQSNVPYSTISYGIISSPVSRSDGEYISFPGLASRYRNYGFDIYYIGAFSTDNSDSEIDTKKGSTGTNMILRLSTSISSHTAAYRGEYSDAFENNYGGGCIIYDYKRNVFSSQYGGNTYNARQYNKYITCSPITYTTTHTCSTYGDTYIVYFDYLKTIWDTEDVLGDGDPYCSVVLLPLETSINTNLSHSDSFKRIFSNRNGFLIHETSGKYFYGGDASADEESNYYTQNLDYYLYNSVYSKLNDIKEYYPKPNDWEQSPRKPYMVKASQQKINGEITDSWTKFKTSDYIEVDSKHGELTNILTYNNKLYFWQPKAFGILSVNTRSLISDSSGLELALGTGGILDRFDYISTGCGNSFRDGVLTTNNALYWYDSNYKHIYSFADALSVLSKAKQIQSYLNNIEYVYDFNGVSDLNKNSVLFNIKYNIKSTVSAISGGGIYVTVDVPDTSGLSIGDSILVNGSYRKILGIGYTSIMFEELEDTYSVSDTILLGISINQTIITYNELVGCFESIYTYKADSFMNLINNYYSIDKNKNSIYLHNSGNRCEFYGVVHPSTVKLLCNSDYNSIKTFDNIRFASTSLDNNGVNIFYDTFNEIRVYNDYQNSDFITLVPGEVTTNLTRRERDWTLQIPRNAITTNLTSNPDIFDSSNIDLNRQFKERIRDRYIVIDLKYNNTNNYKLNIPYVNTEYRYSIR